MSRRDRLPARLANNVPTFKFAGNEWPLGPAMLALDNDRQRAFVIAWTQLVNQLQRGARKHAAQLAGYDCKPENASHQGSDLLLRDDIRAAIAEMDEPLKDELGGLAMRALKAQVMNPMSKGHMKATEIVAARTWSPVTTIRHEKSEDKSEIFLNLVDQLMREGRSKAEIRKELEAKGDPAAVSAIDYYLARAQAVDAEAVEVKPKKTAKRKDIVEVSADDDEW